MRVIAGRLGGRNFMSPPGHRTHPMSDKIRGALFNALGDLQGLRVLDAFAGSGALGFEALSRGAESVLAIESDRAAQQTIIRNIQTLGLTERCKLIKASASAWLTTSSQDFDIVLLDPPYDAVKPSLLIRLAERVDDGGLVVMSLPPSIELFLSESEWRLLSRKDYGDAQLLFYHRQVWRELLG